MSMRRNSDWITKVDAELANWPGVSHFRKLGGSRHSRLYLTYGERSRFVVFPSSPCKSPSAILNHIQDVRRTLRELGAEKVLDVEVKTS